jgi:hypothetical protein
MKAAAEAARPRMAAGRAAMDQKCGSNVYVLQLPCF